MGSVRCLIRRLVIGRETDEQLERLSSARTLIDVDRRGAQSAQDVEAITCGDEPLRSLVSNIHRARHSHAQSLDRH